MKETPRTELAGWVRQQVEGKAHVSLPDVVTDAVNHFSGQRQWVTAFLAESLRPIVYDIAQNVVAGTRSDWSLLGDQLISREELEEMIQEKTMGKWTRWLEHIEGEHHVRLLDMTKDHLLLAAKSRRGQAAPHLRAAAMFEEMAEKVPPGKVVRDVFKEADLARLFQKHGGSGPLARCA